jgi:repressor LexA
LTERQAEILNFIKEYISINGFPPSYREIGEQFNIASTFGVKRHLDALIKKGYITIDSKANRSICLTQKCSSIFEELKLNNSVEIPILGRVAAGYPVLSQENIEGTLVIDSSLITKEGQYFCLKVRGDSMINEGIFEGDTVIVRSQNTAKNNDIVIAMVDDESTVKKYFSKNNKTHLVPANDKYSIIDLTGKEDFKILGKVVGVYRWIN